MKIGAAVLTALSIYVFGGFQAAARGDERELTLERAIAQAVKNSTISLKSENQEELSRVATTRARNQFLPNLIGTGQFGPYTGRSISILTTPYLIDATGTLGTYDLTATLNVFNGFADTYGLSAARERERAAHSSLVRTRQSAAMDIIQSFLRVILDQELTDIAGQNLKVSQDRLKLFQAQAQVGVTSTSDLYRQQAQTSADELALIRARTQTNADRLILVQKLRLDPLQNYILKTPELDVKVDWSETPSEEMLIKSAFENREDLRALASQTQAAEHDVTSARSTYYPLVDISLGLNGAGRYLTRDIVNGIDSLPPGQRDLFTQLGDQVVFSALLTLTWNIFDRSQTQLNVEQAHVTAANLALDHQDLHTQVVNDVKQARINFLGALDEVKTSLVGLTAAEAAYKLIEGRYHVGQASFIDLTTAQAALVQARGNRVQALIDFRVQRDLLNFTAGKDPE